MWSLTWISPAWVTTVINEKENSYQIHFQIRVLQESLDQMSHELILPGKTDGCLGVQVVLGVSCPRSCCGVAEAPARRRAEVGRDLCRAPGQGARSWLPRTVSLGMSLRMEPHSLSGQPAPALSHPHSKKIPPCVQTAALVFQLVPVASGPVTGSLWKEPGSVLFTSSLQVIIHGGEITPNVYFSIALKAWD